MFARACTSLLNLYRIRREPFSLVHFVTARCNARCGHCFIDFSEPSSGHNELTLDEMDLLTRSLGNCLYNVNITGGEPFIREDLFEIIALYARNTPVRSIVITTNGWFVGAIKSFLERYAQLDTPCHVRFSISIDNHEQMHDAHRKLAGSYERALESYRLLNGCSDKRISVDIAVTVMPANMAVVADLFHHLRRAGVKEFSPILLREEGVLKHIPCKKDLLRAYGDLTSLVEANTPPGRDRNIANRMADAVRRAKSRIVQKAICTSCCSPRFFTPCRAGSLFGVIHADGSVSPCELLGPSGILGNLRRCAMDFGQIWKSDTATQARSRIIEKGCSCTFECAWTVNVLSNPAYLPGLAYHTLLELI